MTVIYIQCPHCKKGWYGYPTDLETVIKTKDGTEVNLLGKLKCFDCQHEYYPLSDELAENEDGLTVDLGNNGKVTFKKNTNITKMSEFVANLLMTCKGH